MNANTTPASRPLLIGGSSAYGCRLLGDYINRLPDYDCGPVTNVFCHPKIWNGSGKDWSDFCIQSLQKPLSKAEGFLPWCKIRTRNFHPYYLRGTEVYDLLESSNDGADFAANFFRSRLITSSANSWADATPENCYAAEEFLNAMPEGEVILLIEHAFPAMSRLIKEGFSPKVAAKTWVTESALAAGLLKRHQVSGRVHLIRLEDLLSNPIATVETINRLLLSNATQNPETRAILGDSRLETMHESEREELLLERERQQADLAPHHKDYLLGTAAKPLALKQFGNKDAPLSGAELLCLFGYEDSPPTWEPVKLAKLEQSLGSPKASFINPLADFTKAPKKTHSPDKSQTKKRRSRFQFWKADTQTKIPEKPLPPPFPSQLFPNQKSVFQKHSEPPELEADLDPELSSETLDLAVVIAFLGRHEIIALVVRELVQLRDLGFNLAVFLTCSDARDFLFAKKLREELGGIGVRFIANRPLGRKWQTGVDFARQSNPKNLLITGSDDLVSRSYLTHAISLLSEEGPSGGFEFAAPESWFLYDVDTESELAGSLWELAYQPSVSIPLGAGRVYASRLLDRFDWKLFHETHNRRLDECGHRQLLDSKARSVLIPAKKGTVLSVKGGWQAMNSTDSILSSLTTQCRSCDFEKEQFFEDHFELNSANILDAVKCSRSQTKLRRPASM
ncbi:MAG: hypothetical protein QM496_00950 [Verrucomicrobiota bacterium]